MEDSLEVVGEPCFELLAECSEGAVVESSFEGRLAGSVSVPSLSLGSPPGLVLHPWLVFGFSGCGVLCL